GLHARPADSRTRNRLCFSPSLRRPPMLRRLVTPVALLALTCLSPVAAANDVVEIVGRVSSASLSTGPWAGVRVGESVHLTYEVVPSTIIDPLHARNYTLAGYDPSGPGTQVNTQVKMTVRGQTLNLIMTNAANPAVVNWNDYPRADGH